MWGGKDYKFCLIFRVSGQNAEGRSPLGDFAHHSIGAYEASDPLK